MANKQGEFVRAYQNYDTEAVSDSTGVVFVGDSLAIQSQRDEADINTIVRNFGITGKLPDNVRVPSYGDFDMVDDYRSAIEAVREAEASFMKMSADVRSRFQNDPQLFLEYCTDPSNLEEMRKLGLAVPRPIPEDTVPIAPDA